MKHKTKIAALSYGESFARCNIAKPVVKIHLETSYANFLLL